jgi:hypothetical protein
VHKATIPTVTTIPYYNSNQPDYIITNDVPVAIIGGVPEFIDPPNGINTGEVDILYRHRSPGSPGGA